MKRHLLFAAFALGAAVLLGLAVSHARAADGPPAQLPKGPGDQPAPSASPTPQTQVAPPGAPVVVAAPPAACCPAPACCEVKKVCVGEKATRTIEKRAYDESCEDFCLPKCPLWSGFGHGHKHDDCGACPDAGCDTCTKCEHCVRERKYLVIHVRKEEECYNKCHVECQPAEPKYKKYLFHHKQECADGACLPPAGCAGVVVQAPPAPMPSAEQLPNPPKEKK